MKILFYFGHPAQYYFLKHSIKQLRDKGHQTTILIKTKDVLEDLLKDDQEDYINIFPEGRKQKKISILLGLIKRDIRLFRLTFNKRYNLFIGTDPSLAHVGYILRIPVLTVLEDDYEVIPSLAKLTYPFTSYIVTPACVKVGKYENKKIGYSGYMKLAYLHPNYFKQQEINLKKPFFILRLSQLNAHHDFDIKGISESLLDQIIALLSKQGTVFISSEKTLSFKYESYKLRINPTEIHHYLSNSSMLISDSQSMSVEAAMLGIPSIRLSDFVGKISVLEELEHTYQLTFGISPSEPQKMIDKINQILEEPNFSERFQQRRERMLSEKIDVTAFMVWLIENYPESVGLLKKDRKYQNHFK